MPKELRCPSKLHGVINAEGNIEVKCGSRWCGARPGVVVLHIFDPATGAVVGERSFRDPMRERK